MHNKILNELDVLLDKRLSSISKSLSDISDNQKELYNNINIIKSTYKRTMIDLYSFKNDYQLDAWKMRDKDKQIKKYIHNIWACLYLLIFLCLFLTVKVLCI